MRWCMILLVGVGLGSAQYNEPVCEDVLEGARLGLGAMVKLLLAQETLQMEYQQSRDDLQRQMHATLLNLLQLLADVPAAPSYAPPPSQYGTLPPSFYPIPLSTTASYRPPTTTASYRPPTTTASYRPPTTTASYRPPTTTASYRPPTTTSSYRPPTTTSPYRPSTTPSPVYRPRTTSSYSTTTPLYPATRIPLPGYQL